MELTITLGGGFNTPLAPLRLLAERCLTNVMQSAKVLAFPPMNLIKLLLLAALVATVIVLFAEGPDLLTIIDQH